LDNVRSPRDRVEIYRGSVTEIADTNREINTFLGDHPNWRIAHIAISQSEGTFTIVVNFTMVNPQYAIKED
jgi:hypothetical protein